jgi:hypothetical protein
MRSGKPKAVLVSFFVGIFLLIAIIQEGQASLITYNFTGNVDHLSPLLSGQFNTMQTLSGSLTYDTSVPDSDSSSDSAYYLNSIAALTFTIDGYTGVSLGAHNHTIIDNNSSMNSDMIAFEAHNISAPSIGTLLPDSFSLYFYDFSQSALSNDTFPEIMPDLSLFNVTQWEYVVKDTDGSILATIIGNITPYTAEPSQVPEPSTVLLIGTGLALVGVLRKSFKN